MKAISLFKSPLLSVREVVCDAPRGGHGGAELNGAACVAIPLRGCYSVERSRNVIVADANTAMLFDTQLPYRVAHPADGGDVSLVLEYAPNAIVDAFEKSAPLAVNVPARLQLQARLFRRTLLSDDGEALGIEETAFAILRQLAVARNVDPNIKRRTAVERAKSFLGEHFREKVSLANTARAAGISSFALARAFPVVTGMTMHRYLTALRHAAALDAIAGGEIDLSGIAAEVGFAHHSHLTKTFRAVFGTTPSAIRPHLRYAKT